jgi:hypothetical protein
MKLSIELHVVSLTKGLQPLKNRTRKYQESQNDIVEDANYGKKQPFATLAVIELPEPRQYERQTACHIGVTLGSAAT